MKDAVIHIIGFALIVYFIGTYYLADKKSDVKWWSWALFIIGLLIEVTRV